jgi:hypothetical protein
MSLSLGEKAQRVLKLLLGLRNPRVASALAVYGFTEADMEEGWRLLQALGQRRLDRLPVGPRDADVIQKLDNWENLWFPIIDASLHRRFPATHERLFLNLSQTEGPEVAVSVQAMLDRIAQLDQADGPYGAEGPKARELLKTRGLTDASLAEVRALLGSLAKVAPAPTPLSVEEEQARMAAAEDALWAWYLEWSQLARVGIKNRTLLRQLGFLSSKAGDSGDAGEDEPLPLPSLVNPAPVA